VTGCSTARVADLRDCGRASIGIGVGLGADISVGAICHPAVGVLSHTKATGLVNRDMYGTWTQDEMYFPVLSVGMLLIKPSEIVQATYLCHYKNISGGRHSGGRRAGRWFNFPSATEPKYTTLFARATDLEVGATLGFVSMRVGVNPLEIVDLVFSTVGLDIAGDDGDEEAKGAVDPKGDTEWPQLLCAHPTLHALMREISRDQLAIHASLWRVLVSIGFNEACDLSTLRSGDDVAARRLLVRRAQDERLTCTQQAMDAIKARKSDIEGAIDQLNLRRNDRKRVESAAADCIYEFEQLWMLERQLLEGTDELFAILEPNDDKLGKWYANDGKILPSTRELSRALDAVFDRLRAQSKEQQQLIERWNLRSAQEP